MHQSRLVYRKSYFLQDNRYGRQYQCIISPTFYRTIDTLVETSVPLVLLSVLLLMHHSRTLCCWFYILQCYRYTSHHQCVVSGSEMQKFFIFKTFHVIYQRMEPRSWCLVFYFILFILFIIFLKLTKLGTRNLFNQKKSRLATKRFHKITK